MTRAKTQAQSTNNGTVTNTAGTTRYASPEAVEALATDWTDEILKCRMYSHNWHPVRAEFNAVHRYYVQILGCDRCGTQHYQELSPSGTVYASWYLYPDGYLSKKIGRIVGESRDLLRMLTMARAFDVEKTKSPTKTLPRSKRTRKALDL